MHVFAGAVILAVVLTGAAYVWWDIREQALEQMLTDLWDDDDKVAADAGPAVGLADVGGDNTPAWQPSLCVGRTSQAGAGPFDRERSLREV